VTSPARPAPPAARRRSVSIEHEVPFHDVDLTQRVWHGHYYKYFELARTALFRRYGLHDVELIPKQYHLYVIETRCRYSSPLHYGDRMRVSAWFRDTKRRLAIGYEIENLSRERRAARGFTAIVIVDPSGEMLTETPPAIAERIRAADAV
jgi:acyl-CoA thioester hydrolase